MFFFLEPGYPKLSLKLPYLKLKQKPPKIEYISVYYLICNEIVYGYSFMNFIIIVKMSQSWTRRLKVSVVCDFENRKVLCAPGPRTEHFERLFCRSINFIYKTSFIDRIQHLNLSRTQST